MLQTEHFGMNLPEESDAPDIGKVSENFETIDQMLHERDASALQQQAAIDGKMNRIAAGNSGYLLAADGTGGAKALVGPILGYNYFGTAPGKDIYTTEQAVRGHVDTVKSGLLPKLPASTAEGQIVTSGTGGAVGASQYKIWNGALHNGNADREIHLPTENTVKDFVDGRISSALSKVKGTGDSATVSKSFTIGQTLINTVFTHVAARNMVFAFDAPYPVGKTPVVTVSFPDGVSGVSYTVSNTGIKIIDGFSSTTDMHMIAIGEAQ